jgi:integrase
MGALRSHRARQHQERLLMGAGWRDHDLVFTKVDGEALHPERVSREFTRRIERWGLPTLTLHGLRHTWATLALKAGVNAKVVQERLGHATIGITLGTYSHVTAGMQREAAEAVASLIFGTSS